MKTFVRLSSLALALVAAGFLAGCAGYRSTQSTQRAVNASDFEVVETSTKRLLTTQEMLQLKIAVAQYLDKEGAVASGDYYVKIFLGPDQDGVPADWVVVRFTRDSTARISLLASYPANSPGYQSYAAYDYYPYGYDHFSRISFQYYNDPYYGRGYYFPPRRYDHDRGHDHDRDKGRDRDRDKDRDGDTPPAGDRPRFKPIDPVGSPTQVTRTHGEGTRSGGNSPRRNYQPGDENRPPREPTPAPPPEASRNSGGPASRSELHRRSEPRSEPARQESNRSESRVRSSDSYSSPSPSYSAPARSESNASSSQTQREETPSHAKRQGLE